jgi:hypothetical protein
MYEAQLAVSAKLAAEVLNTLLTEGKIQAIKTLREPGKYGPYRPGLRMAKRVVENLELYHLYNGEHKDVVYIPVE